MILQGFYQKNGKVLGMMPHPERAISSFHGNTDGLLFLKTSIEQIIG
jgi:phosphoribosylformylglycinamidine synthase